jgi:hypothetical protein
MAQVFQFPEKVSEGVHKWYHFPYTSVSLRFNQYDCIFCDKCQRWLIRKKVAKRFLYIKDWVTYDEFQDILENNVMADLKPRLVWFLLHLERLIEYKYSNKTDNVFRVNDHE